MRLSQVLSLLFLFAGVAAAQPAVRPSERTDLPSTLPIDQTAAAWYDEAQSLAAENQTAKAIASVQRIFELPTDSYLRDRDGQWRTLRRAAERWLIRLGAPAAAEYRRQFEDDAAFRLKEAAQVDDEDRLAEVGRRYPLTNAGFEAMDRLATRALDRGRPAIAAAWWKQLSSHPGWRDSAHQQSAVKAAIAAALLADPGRPADGPRPPEWTNFGGARRRTDELLQAARGMRPPRRASADWTVFGGDAERNAFVLGGLPLLAGERTGAAVPIAGNTRLAKQIEALVHYNREKERPILLGTHAVAAGGRVYYRSFGGVHAVDLAAGAPAWKAPYQGADPLESQSLQSDDWRPDSSPTAAALELAVARNSLLGSLSTDGERVYLVEQCQANAATIVSMGFGGRNNEDNVKFAYNRLTALDAATGATEWSLGGAGKPASDSTFVPAPDVFFLGPPLPYDGKLYVLAEARSEIQLVAIDPKSGRIEWRQGLAVAERRIDGDAWRRTQACPIAASQGILVCPTLLQRVAAVDVRTRTILWNRFFDADAMSSPLRSSSLLSAYDVPSTTYQVDPPVVVGRRVLVTGPTLRSLHCVDLQSGALLWSEMRGMDLYLAGATDEAAVLVGNQGVRTIGLVDGKTRWSASTPAPSGRGVMLSGQYLLPLERGGVASVDLARGVATSSAGSTSGGAAPLGNLLIHANMLVSAGRFGLRVYPLREDVERESRERLVKRADDPRGLFLSALLLLQQGETLRAVDALYAATSTKQAFAERDAVRSLLFQIAADEGLRDAARMGGLAQRLLGTAASQAEKVVALRLAAEHRLATKDFRGALEAAEKLLETGPAGMLAQSSPAGPVDRSPAVWARWIVARAFESADGKARTELLERLRERAKGDLAGKAPVDDRYVALAEMYSDVMLGQAAATRLAFDAIRRKDASRAELRFLRLADDAGESSQAAALFGASEACRAAGKYVDAMDALQAWKHAHPKVRDPLGKTVDERIDELRKAAPAGFAATPGLKPSWGGPEVRIESRTSRNDFRTTQWVQPTGSPARGLQRVLLANRNDRLIAWDRASGQKVFEAPLNLGIQRSSSSSALGDAAAVGHTMFFAQNGVVVAASMLESDLAKRRLWSTPLRRDQEARDAAKATLEYDARSDSSGGPPTQLGPVGPGFLAVRSGRDLVVLDPATGAERWRRSELGTSGDFVVGDSRRLVVVGPQGACTVYRTSDGEHLGAARWPSTPRPYYRPAGIGTRVLVQTFAADAVRLQLIDLVDGKPAWSKDWPARSRWDARSGAAVATVVEPSGKAYVVEVATGRELVADEFPAAKGAVGSIQTFVDDERRYVAWLQPQSSPPSTRTAMGFSGVDVVAVDGPLRAYDLKSGRRLWEKRLPYSRLVRRPSDAWPVLVTIEDLPANDNPTDGVLRRVTILDKETGAARLSRDVLLEQWLSEFSFDAKYRRIELLGYRRSVRIEFADKAQQQDDTADRLQRVFGRMLDAPKGK